MSADKNNDHNLDRNCTRNIKRKCSECAHRKWVGDYALNVCEISGKVVEVYYYCDLKGLYE